MTFEALETDAARQRKLYATDPHEYKSEMLRGIRNRAALIERFFALGTTVTSNFNDRILPDSMDDQMPIAMALEDLAGDIVVAATWLDSQPSECVAEATDRKAVRR
jgi:hypothetical protein